MKSIMMSLAAMVTLLVASPALAQDWSQTFHPDSLPDELSAIRVVIAPGGPGAAAAGRALRQNLLNAGSPMAIDNPVMSSVEGLADEEVIARLKHLPVDAIVIVRTFGDEDEATAPFDAPHAPDDEPDDGSLAALFRRADAENNEQPARANMLTDDPELIARMEELEAQQREDASSTPATEPVESTDKAIVGGLGLRGTPAPEATASMAMITFYSIEGAAIAGFMVYPGVPLTSEQRRNIGRGISQETFDATQSAMEAVVVGKDTAEPSESGRLRLQAQGHTWQLHDTETGDTRTDADIYRTLGRDDLASTFEANARSKARRTTLGRVTGYAGLGALAAGSALAISTYLRQFPADDPAVAMCSAYSQPAMQNNCRAQESFDALSGQRITGLSLAGVGVVAAITGLIIRGAAAAYSPHPLSYPQTRALVDEANQTHNATEREEGGGVSGGRLGGQPLPQTDAAEGMRLQLSPYLQGGPETRGGLQLRGRW